MYVTNSKVGWCDWIISNIEYKDRKKRKSVVVFSSNTKSHAKTKWMQIGYALLKHDSLIEIYREKWIYKQMPIMQK